MKKMLLKSARLLLVGQIENLKYKTLNLGFVHKLLLGRWTELIIKGMMFLT